MLEIQKCLGDSIKCFFLNEYVNILDKGRKKICVEVVKVCNICCRVSERYHSNITNYGILLQSFYFIGNWSLSLQCLICKPKFIICMPIQVKQYIRGAVPYVVLGIHQALEIIPHRQRTIIASMNLEICLFKKSILEMLNNSYCVLFTLFMMHHIKRGILFCVLFYGKSPKFHSNIKENNNS